MNRPILITEHQNDLKFIHRIKLYIKIFFYNEIEKVFGRNNTFEISYIINKNYYPLNFEVTCTNGKQTITVTIPTTFFNMSDDEQFNRLASQIHLEHKLQKNG